MICYFSSLKYFFAMRIKKRAGDILTLLIFNIFPPLTMVKNYACKLRIILASSEKNKDRWATIKAALS